MIVYLVEFAMQIASKYIMFRVNRYWAKGPQKVLKVWPLYRQAALAALSSCEQDLPDYGSLAIGYTCLPHSNKCSNREKRFAH